MVKRFVVPFAATGDKTTTPDATDPGGAISYSQGWPVAYQLPNSDPNYRPVGRQEMNGVFNDVTGAIGEMQALGFPEWVAVAGLVPPYAINATMRHNNRIFRSLITNNSDEPGVGAGATSWEDVTVTKPLFFTVDASAGPVTVTLPTSDAALGVTERIYRRTDIGANAAVIAASGTDRIMLDTSASTTGSTQTELIFGGDYLRLRSDGAGKWWCVGQAQLPASIGTGAVRYSVAGVSTFTVPAVLRSGRRRATVAVTGSGGGGGGTTSSTAAASGGGGGGCTAIRLIDLTGVVSVAVTIATGGAGGSGAGNGSAGNTTSFGPYLSAGGGSGGPSSAGSSTFSGAGSTASTNADATYPGGAGKYSIVAGGGGLAAAGVGGDTFFTKGSGAPNLSGTAVAALPGNAGLIGGGGSGAVSYNASSIGGPGGPGYCEIKWG